MQKDQAESVWDWCEMLYRIPTTEQCEVRTSHCSVHKTSSTTTTTDSILAET